jgi:hypothetical protein
VTNRYRYDDTPSLIHGIDGSGGGLEEKYSELTAIEKCAYLFDSGIRATAYENYMDEERPDSVIGLSQFGRSTFKSLQSQSLSETLTYPSDEFLKPKPKIIHTYGSTARILFQPEPDTPYTGILSRDAHGLARFSYAGPAAAVGAVPALALKFPIDGDRPSENLLVLNKLDRQQPFWRFFSKNSHNSVFQNPMTNRLPTPRFTNLIIRTLNKRFQSVVKEGTVLHQSLDNLTRIHIDGTVVEREKSVTPHRIILLPTTAADAASDPTIEFRDDLSRNIKAGTTIYETYALTEEQEQKLNPSGKTKLADLLSHAERIGTITTESEFVASKYGDYRLFFKHDEKFILDRYKRAEAQDSK